MAAARKVSAAQRRTVRALAAELGGELAAGGGLAGAVDADHHDDFGRGWRVGDRFVDGVEDVEDLGFEEPLELGAVGDAAAEGDVAELGDDLLGGAGADIRGEQGELEVVERGLVDFAGEGDDGGDGAGEGLAGAGDRLLHAVEEAAGLLGLGFCRRFGGFALAEE